ncbi:MAG: hypothetical protein ACRDQA_01890 [Nocardioidaceae bacterium]
MGLGALLVLALAGTGYITLASHVEQHPYGGPGSATAVAVEWRQVEAGDLDKLTQAMGSGLVIPFREKEATGEENGDSHTYRLGSQGAGLVLGVRCAQMARYLPLAPCQQAAPRTLSDPTQNRLSQFFAATSGVSSNEIRLVPRDQLASSGHAFVVDRSTLPILEERVRTVAIRTLPAPSVESLLHSRPVASPLVRWIIAGTAVALVTLVVGCLLSLVDRLLATRRRERHLMNLGMSPRQLTALGALRFAVPYAIVAALGTATGLIICITMVNPGVPVPWLTVAAILAGALVVGVAGTVAVAALGTRQALQEAE